MRHLLISVAALALSAGAALAQPDQGHGRGHERGQNAGQPETAQQPAPQQQGTWSRDPNRPMQGQPPRTAQGGGPTNFTNQIQGHQPDQGQARDDRGNWQRGGDRGNWQGRGVQGPQQQAVAPSQNPQDQNRRRERDNFTGYREGRSNEDRGAYGGRYEGQREYDNRGGFGGRYGEGQRGYDNRGSDRYASRPGNPAFNGGRFNGFRDFHRDYRAEHRFHVGGYRRPGGWYSHRWVFGEFLPRPFWARDYWLVDYADYDLPPPPYGAVWVRVDDDALLIDRDSGEIITVVYGVFY